MNALYKVACVATALLFLRLAGQLLLSPSEFVIGAGQVPSVASDIVLGRTAMFMLGIVALAASAFRLTASPARRAICTSMCVVFLGLACMGTREFLAGRLNASILVAAGVETTLGLLFAAVLLSDLRARRDRTPPPA